MLIEIEGIDGAGKTTQCSLLKEWIKSKGYEAVMVREPGGTDFGEMLRKAIMSSTPRDKNAEMFAFLACKSQLYTQIIIPSLAADKYVVSDRGSGSFLSYHNVTSQTHFRTLMTLMRMATLNTIPTVTFLLDLPVETAMQRSDQKEQLSKFDKLEPAFFEKQRSVFLRLKKCFRHWVLIDALLPIEEVHSIIKKEPSFLF